MFNNFFSENRALCEIMWKNTVDADRPQMAIWRKYTVCWITEVTNTHAQCVMLSALPLKYWLHHRASVSRLCITCLSRSRCLKHEFRVKHN
jgi:hypothetical protein